jgi:hypothetical protein
MTQPAYTPLECEKQRLIETDKQIVDGEARVAVVRLMIERMTISGQDTAVIRSTLDEIEGLLEHHCEDRRFNGERVELLL